MNVDGKHYQTIWLKPGDPSVVQTIDQRALPYRFVIEDLRTYRDGHFAIEEMIVRGAPLIGATAAWSIYLATLEALGSEAPEAFIADAAQEISRARPTAVNLHWAVQRMLRVLRDIKDDAERIEVARQEARIIAEEDVRCCRSIGAHGLSLIAEVSARKAGEPVNILTHCNYLAHERGIAVHVWVDETRPRNQGSQLTAWELARQGVPHTLIVDNAGGHLMQQGLVDLCITGTDRTTRTGDVANKIGTYLKALAAHDNGIPFYVAAPSTSIDWDIASGHQEIPIEERSPDEVAFATGLDGNEIRRVRIVPETTPIRNFAFDVTPARLVTGLITERGICPASAAGLRNLFPDKAVDISDDGYIKFDIDWTEAPPPAHESLVELEAARQLMVRHGLIGHDPEQNVDYGNLSIRGTMPTQMIITGTQTGHLPCLSAEHYALVTDCDIAANRVSCRGRIKASSETLTHAAIYALSADIQAVIHGHDVELWSRLLDKVPSTASDVAYGTPEMAREFQRLYAETDLPERKVAVMGGHRGGLISFGASVAEAEHHLLEYV